MITVEDYIEVLAGVQSGGDSINLDRSDYNLIGSLARQTFKGIPYTDRQCDLAKNKIIYYKDQLNLTDFTVNDLDKLRMPLREIDRSRWIKLEETSQGESIAVRFTFQKKLISALEKLSIKPYHYDKVRKIQYFLYSEKSLFDVVNAFKDRNFDIDPSVQDVYDKINLFNKEETVPGLYNYKLKNLPESATKLIIKELGNPSQNNAMLYKDRSLKYGINVTYTGETNSLESRIATRKEPNISLDSNTINVDTLLLALENLKRHKLMVLVASGDNNSCYDDVVQVHEYIKNLIQPSEVSVTFRLDNVSDGLEFNRYIRREGINNKVDNNTKVVYNLNNKLPKPLYNSNWIPDAIILLNSNGYIATRKVLDCYPNVDLIIHLNNPSMVAGYGAYYMKRGIHKI
jgi:hypothetical protein